MGAGAGYSVEFKVSLANEPYKLIDYRQSIEDDKLWHIFTFRIAIEKQFVDWSTMSYYDGIDSDYLGQEDISGYIDVTYYGLAEGDFEDVLEEAIERLYRRLPYNTSISFDYGAGWVHQYLPMSIKKSNVYHWAISAIEGDFEVVDFGFDFPELATTINNYYRNPHEYDDEYEYA